MKKIIKLLVFVFITQISLFAQDAGFYFGPKGGLSIATQKWDNYDRNPLLTYHGALFMESLDTNFKGALYAQLGYHTRGSAIRGLNSISGFSFTRGFQFRNISLGLGIKKRIYKGTSFTPFYIVGVRLEYTLSSNLASVETTINPFFPFKEFTNKWNYGISFGGGFEYEAHRNTVAFVEFNFAPDLSFQYRSPPFLASDPYSGQNIQVSERSIRNITLEITFGIRFLREVIYID